MTRGADSSVQVAMDLAGHGLTDEDETFLDQLCDLVFRREGDGAPLDVAELLEGREHLRAELEELVRVARLVRVQQPPGAPDLPGYEVEGVLGEGAMGTVYLARQLALGSRRVALKVLPPQLGLDRRARDRFLTEARGLARVRHANVVGIHDVIDADGVCAYAMEWVEGQTLGEWLRAGHATGRGAHAVAPAFCCRVGIAIARALDAVHAAGLLHRDVKPSNILLRQDGMALLSDFGLVRDADAALHTQAGTFVGTLAYAPPEQLRADASALGPWSDVYSLGATLYEMLTAEPPFRSDSPTEQLRRIEAGDVRLPRRIDPRIPRDLETVVMKALEADPARRYRSAGEFADDFERILRLEPVQARRAGPATRIEKFARRHRWPIAAALLGAGVAIAIAVALWVREERRRAIPAEFERRVAAARLALLDPVHEERAFIAANLLLDVPPEPRADAPARALADYGVALALDPAGDVIGNERASAIRLERDVVALTASLLAKDPTAPSVDPMLSERCPLTAKIAALWQSGDRDEIQRDLHRISGSTPDDRRALGPLAFLLGDAGLCHRAWEGSDLAPAPGDPVVDAALGMLFLLQDDPARAYPRLLRAHEAFPEAGFLALHLADAACRNGDLTAATRWLETARGLPLPDPYDGTVRVEADLCAARGEIGRARELYEFMVAHRSSPRSRFMYANLLAAQGNSENIGRAVNLLLQVAEGRPTMRIYARAFMDLAQDWWESLPPDHKIDVLAVTGASGTIDVERVARAWRKVRRAHREHFWRENTMLRRVRSSLWIDQIALGDLDLSLEIIHMDPSDRACLSLPLKRVLAALFSVADATLPMRRHPVLHLAMREAARALLRVVRPAVLAAAAPLAALLPAPALLGQNTSGRWVSLFNGYTNDSRAAGQVLRANWQEAWRTPLLGGGLSFRPLVDQGLVVFQPANTPEMRVVTIDTGRPAWSGGTIAVGPSCNNYYFTGCILNGRFFLPLSNQGSCANMTPRIEAYDLASGACRGRWDYGTAGVISSLQAIPQSAGVARDEIIFSIAEVTPTGWLNQRTVALDAKTMSCATALSARTGTPYGGVSLEYSPPAFHAPSGNLFVQRYVLPAPVSGGMNWASTAIRRIALNNLQEQGQLALSGATLSTGAFWIGLSPLVIHPAGDLGYLYDTGGYLVAVDLVSGQAAWCTQPSCRTQVRTQPSLESDQGAPYVLGDVVIFADGVGGTLSAYDRMTGSRQWTLSASSSQLPANPRHYGGCVLDGDLLLLPFADGHICAVDASGNVAAAHVVPGVNTVIASNGYYLVGTSTELIAFKAANLLPQAPARINTSMPIVFSSPADANRGYVVPFSAGNAGFTLPPPDNRLVPVNPDGLFWTSLLAGGGVFVNTVGVLDATGHATVAFNIPNLPVLNGITLYACGLALDPAASFGVQTISPPLTIPITQ